MAARRNLCWRKSTHRQETLDDDCGKARGATFGALSETELDILKQSASKIGTWMQRDKAAIQRGNLKFPKKLSRRSSIE